MISSSSNMALRRVLVLPVRVWAKHGRLLRRSRQRTRSVRGEALAESMVGASGKRASITLVL